LQQRRPAGDVGRGAELDRDQARQVGALYQVGEHVLAVAGAELQPAEQVDQVRVQAVDVGVERRPLPLFDDALLDLGQRLGERLLAASRVDAPVGDQAVEGQAGGLAAHPVEARDPHGPRRVVDDDVDPGELLERLDVAALAADDPALHPVVGQVDELRGRALGMRAGKPLRRRREDAAGALLGLAPRLLLDLAQRQARLAAGVGLDFLEQHPLRLLGCERGDPFQFSTPQLGELRVERLQPAQDRFGSRAVAA